MNKKLCSIKLSDKHGHYMLKMIHVFPKIWKQPGYTLKTTIMTRLNFFGELTVWNRNTPIYFENTCYRSYCEWLIHACVFLFLQLIKMSQLDLPVKTKDFSIVIYALFYLPSFLKATTAINAPGARPHPTFFVCLWKHLLQLQSHHNFNQ